MKTTKETKRIDKANGHYLLFERITRVKNGIKQSTAWHNVYNSECGY